VQPRELKKSHKNWVKKKKRKKKKNKKKKKFEPMLEKQSHWGSENDDPNWRGRAVRACFSSRKGSVLKRRWPRKKRFKEWKTGRKDWGDAAR